MMQITRRAGGKLNQRSRVMYHCPWGGEKTYENAVKRGSGNADFGKGIWQRRFWEHHIKDADDYALHDHLIATAPLRAGLLWNGGDWPLCSAYKRRMRFNASSVKTTDQAPSNPNSITAGNATQTA